MVKKSDIEELYSQIKRIPTTPSDGTLTGSSQGLGENLMKLKITNLMQDWYATLNTGATK